MKSASNGLKAGFTLVEMIVATAIMLTVTAAVFTVLNPAPAQGIFLAQPEMADMQQRLRVGVDALTHDLVMAGAGAHSGSQSGSLAGFFAPILPSRQGSSAARDDGPDVFKTDAITLLYVASTAPQTTTSSAMTNPSSALTVDAGPECPVGTPLCGFMSGMTAVIYDSTGAFDTFEITEVVNSSLQLRHAHQGNLSKAYPAGAKIARIAQHVYYLDTTTNQLMHYDGVQTTMPVLDNVVGLNFEYYGDPSPAEMQHPGVDQSTTYGPMPPAPGASNAPWPEGENCTIQVVGGEQVPRLATLGNAGGGLVQLTPRQLTDGNESADSAWCPDASSPNRFDADLLRIRKVRVTIRLQTPNGSLRGSLTAGPDALFTNPGTSSGGHGLVPDHAIRFDVSPRNMNLAR
jgi:prepilin-type N-terminal cleavage/methylation domain-containing protein